MAIVIGDRVRPADGGPPLTVVNIFEDGTLECLGQIAHSGASGTITRHAQDAVQRLDGAAVRDDDTVLRAETEPSGLDLPDGQSSRAAPDSAMIAVRAYSLWEAAGRPDGEHEAHWLQAERDLAAESPGIETAISAGDFVNATGRMTPAEAYDENPQAMPRDQSGTAKPDLTRAP